MRYYELTITPQGSSTPFKRWTSYPNGKPDPNALNILFDMPIAPHGVPVGLQTVTVEGISLSDISESQQYTDMNVQLYAGMGGGLPLENKSQSGLIAKGSVFQCFGNWIGTDMTLDFVLNPSVFHDAYPGNFVLNWKKGTQLGDALNQTLKVAYTKHPMPIVQKTASTWTADQDQVGTYDTLEQLATAVVDATENGSNGPVSIVAQNGKLVVFDGSYKPKAKTLVFTDLIGQPTWIRPDTMQVQLVLRADLEVGGIIEMPKGYANAPGAVTTTAAAYPSRIKYGPTFQHQFQITKLRQVGNFRSTNGADWSTIVEAVQL